MRKTPSRLYVAMDTAWFYVACSFLVLLALASLAVYLMMGRLPAWDYDDWAGTEE